MSSESIFRGGTAPITDLRREMISASPTDYETRTSMFPTAIFDSTSKPASTDRNLSRTKIVANLNPALPTSTIRRPLSSVVSVRACISPTDVICPPPPLIATDITYTAAAVVSRSTSRRLDPTTLGRRSQVTTANSSNSSIPVAVKTSASFPPPLHPLYKTGTAAAAAYASLNEAGDARTGLSNSRLAAVPRPSTTGASFGPMPHDVFDGGLGNSLSTTAAISSAASKASIASMQLWVMTQTRPESRHSRHYLLPTTVTKDRSSSDATPPAASLPPKRAQLQHFESPYSFSVPNSIENTGEKDSIDFSDNYANDEFEETLFEVDESECSAEFMNPRAARVRPPRSTAKQGSVNTSAGSARTRASPFAITVLDRPSGGARPQTAAPAVLAAGSICDAARQYGLFQTPLTVAGLQIQRQQPTRPAQQRHEAERVIASVRPPSRQRPPPEALHLESQLRPTLPLPVTLSSDNTASVIMGPEGNIGVRAATSVTGVSRPPRNRAV